MVVFDELPGLNEKEIELSVVVPVYNEQDNIVPLLQEIGDCLRDEIDYEVVVVDDCSDDRTAVNVDAYRAGDTAVRLVGHAARYGQSMALFTGVKCARGRWIATLDGDGQNAPEDIPKLLRVVTSDASANLKLVCGHRKRRRDNWVKRVSSRIANAVRSRWLGDDTPDTGCGLKLLERETFLSLPFFDHMHRFLPALVKRAGGDIVSVEVSHRARMHGKSKYGVHNRLWAGIIDLFGVMWLQKRGVVAKIRKGE